MNSRVSNEPRSGISLPGSRTARYTVLGVLAGVLFPIVASLIKVAELGLPLSLSNMLAAQAIEPLLWITDTAPVFLGLVAGIAGRRQDRVVQANEALVAREAELNTAQAKLEQNVAERTQELNERNLQTRAVVELARQIADVQDLHSLLNAAMELLRKRFGHYAADLYLLDDSRQSAVLRASSTAAGRIRVEAGYHIGSGDQNAIGRVIRRGKLLVSSATPDKTEASSTSAGSSSTAQITLPLVVRGNVIGVLDLHSEAPGPAGQREIEIFQLIADQLAASIENVRLVTDTQATLGQLQALTAQGTRAAWQEYLNDRVLAFQFTPAGVSPLSTDAAMREPGDLNVPLALRGEKIGLIKLRRLPGGDWAQAERELLEKVAAQVALALENARLLEQTRQRAAQEQVISEISTRLNRSLDVDAVLQAAVREFASLPEIAEAEIRLSSSDGHLTESTNGAR